MCVLYKSKPQSQCKYFLSSAETKLGFSSLTSPILSLHTFFRKWRAEVTKAYFVLGVGHRWALTLLYIYTTALVEINLTERLHVRVEKE